MTTPTPRDDLNREARSHLLGAIGCAYDADKALVMDDKRVAAIELDKVIALATEARKHLFGKSGGQPVAGKPEEPQLL